MKQAVKLLFFLFPFSLCAQDVMFSQFYAAPVYLNPALSGISYGPRLSFIYRNQWAGIDEPFVTYSASYDQHFPKIKGGIGVLLLRDELSDVFSMTGGGAAYAYQWKPNEYFTVRMALQASVYQHSLNWQNLRFSSDLIDIRQGFADFTNEAPPDNTNYIYFDAATGFVIYSSKAYGGVAVKHLTQPRQNFYTGGGRLPMNITAHGGFDIPLGKNRFNPDAFLSPNILVAYQKGMEQITLGANLRRQFVFGGLWYRQTIIGSDALIAVIGLTHGIFKFGYSYDLTISQLTPGTGGTHEISLILNFAESEKVKERRKGGPHQCPDFLQ